MNAIFFHDFKSYKSDNDFFAVSFNYTLWKDYLKYFDEMIICSRGYDINLFKDSKSKLSLITGENVTYTPIKSYSGEKDFFLNRNSIKKDIQVNLERADIVIIRLPSVIGSFAYEEAKKMNKEIVIELVGCAFDSLWNHGSLKGKIFAPIMYLKTKKYVNEAKNVIYVTNEFLQRRYPNNKNNIGCSDVKIEVSNDILRKRVNKDNSNKIILGLIGNLNADYKGVSTAIKALKILKDNKVNLKLEVVGGGDYSKYLKEAISLEVDDLIEFKGTYSSGKEIFDWLDYIDIYIQPSYVEGMPRATIEAMSRGCPIA